MADVVTSGSAVPAREKGLPLWAGALLLFVLYFVTGRFGLKQSAVSGFATLIWPPSGIALAFLWIFGRRLWPAVALCAFIL
jgi:integral membrane sensor domain MASE1